MGSVEKHILFIFITYSTNKNSDPSSTCVMCHWYWCILLLYRLYVPGSEAAQHDMLTYSKQVWKWLLECKVICTFKKLELEIPANIIHCPIPAVDKKRCMFCFKLNQTRFCALSGRFVPLDLRFWWGSPRPRSTSAGPMEALCVPSVSVTGESSIWNLPFFCVDQKCNPI